MNPENKTQIQANRRKIFELEVLVNQNKTKVEKECSMIIKTSKSKVKPAIKFILKTHSYSCPAISAFPIEHSHSEFKKWIKEQTES